MNAFRHGSLKYFISLSIFALGVAATPSTSAKSQGNENEIQVTLLGQPCALQGPFDKSTLKLIHAFGPAQINPEINSAELGGSKDRLEKAFEKVRAAHGVPSQLDHYLEKLGRRLEAQTEIFKSLIRYRDTQDGEALLKSCKKFLTDKSYGSVAAFIKKLPAGRDLSQKQIADLLGLYNDGIEPDPEQDFHRITTDKLHLQYTCSFDESGIESTDSIKHS